MRKIIASIIFLVLAGSLACPAGASGESGPKVMVLGFDGMDPVMLQE